jgi:hypothetical protein
VNVMFWDLLGCCAMRKLSFGVAFALSIASAGVAEADGFTSPPTKLCSGAIIVPVPDYFNIENCVGMLGGHGVAGCLKADGSMVFAPSSGQPPPDNGAPSGFSCNWKCAGREREAAAEKC